MASAARSFLPSRVADLLLSPFVPPKPPPAPPHQFSRHRSRSFAVLSCLSGGVSDDFVSTRKSNFDRGFTVIANMMKRIEPLDTSVVSKGVSDSARDSMKQTISTMLGLLPSDQFSVGVRVSKLPLHRLLVSSIITGYTLWNAQYRVSLMRNLHISSGDSRRVDCLEKRDGSQLEDERKEKGSEAGGELREEDLKISPQVLGDLSSEALSYIQQLQSEFYSAKEELNLQKKKNLALEYERQSRNDLLEYLRSLDSDMVSELSQPSSSEVEDIIQQLVQNILQRFFKDETCSHFIGDSAINNVVNHSHGSDDLCDSIDTSRDYLAKLLFWCMLMGHHLRGLENRLHLSCVVGLL